MYRTERNYENLNKGIFPGAGRYDIPILRPELTTAENWISFNYAKGAMSHQSMAFTFSWMITSSTASGHIPTTISA